jgi:hypothetical protein
LKTVTVSWEVCVMMRRRCFSCEALYSRSPLSGYYGFANVGFGEEIACVSFDTTMSVVDSQCRGHFVSRRLNKVRTKSRGQQSLASAVPLPGIRFRMLRHITTSPHHHAIAQSPFLNFTALSGRESIPAIKPRSTLIAALPPCCTPYTMPNPRMPSNLCSFLNHSFPLDR